jgi:hypothetical protein
VTVSRSLFVVCFERDPHGLSRHFFKKLNHPLLQDEGFKGGRFEIDYIFRRTAGVVMPDSIRPPDRACFQAHGFRLPPE